MMLGLLAALLLAADASGMASLHRGRHEFQQGNFERALELYEQAATEVMSPKLRAQLHLARGECLAAMRRLPAAEAAFTLALREDPESTLDEARVAPAVLGLFESARARLEGVLEVRTEPVGAPVTLDGRPLTPLPFRGKVPIGRHRVELIGPDGSRDGVTVVVGAEATQVVTLVLRPGAPSEAPAPAPSVSSTGDAARSWGWSGVSVRVHTDLRPGVDLGLGAELSSGLRSPRYALEAGLMLGSSPGGSLRATLGTDPLWGGLRGYAGLAAAVFSTRPLLPSAGVVGGLSVPTARWLDVYAEASLWALPRRAGLEREAVLAAVGFRLHPPAP